MAQAARSVAQLYTLVSQQLTTFLANLLAQPALSGTSSTRSACSTDVSDIGTLQDPTRPIELLPIHQTSMFRKKCFDVAIHKHLFRTCLYKLYDY